MVSDPECHTSDHEEHDQDCDCANGLRRHNGDERQVRDHCDLPLAAYNVSGEYSMIKAAAQNGWIDEQRIIMEVLTGIRRAGADMVITYFAPDVAGWLNEK